MQGPKTAAQKNSLFPKVKTGGAGNHAKAPPTCRLPFNGLCFEGAVAQLSPVTRLPPVTVPRGTSQLAHLPPTQRHFLFSLSGSGSAPPPRPISSSLSSGPLRPRSIPRFFRLAFKPPGHHFCCPTLRWPAAGRPTSLPCGMERNGMEDGGGCGSGGGCGGGRAWRARWVGLVWLGVGGGGGESKGPRGQEGKGSKGLRVAGYGLRVGDRSSEGREMRMWRACAGPRVFCAPCVVHLASCVVRLACGRLVSVSSRAYLPRVSRVASAGGGAGLDVRRRAERVRGPRFRVSGVESQFGRAVTFPFRLRFRFYFRRRG